MLERELAAAVSSERLEDGKSIVSELANNAYQHGVGRIDLTITPLADRIRVEITDQGAGLRPTALDPSGHRGLGLRIVDALALAWGARDGRSQVWAEFAR
jgi:anti-sigma regulatory factor (Ser/Thr protein kinase)